MHPVIMCRCLEPFLSSESFSERDIMRLEDVPLLVPAEFPFTRVAGYPTARGRGTTRELFVQWVDLPNPLWVEVAHMEAECVRAYGSNSKHKELLDRMKKFNRH